MSGIAIIIDGANFANSGLGRVTRKGDTPSGQVTSGLTHDYDLFGAKTTTITDKIGESSSITFLGKILDNCAEITSTSENSVDESSKQVIAAMIQGLNEFTLELVAQMEFSATKDIIIYGDYGSAATGRIQMHVGKLNSKAAGVYVRNNNSWIYETMSDVNGLMDSKPHTFHFVRAANTSSGMLFKFYIDGVLAGTAEYTSLQVSTVATLSDVLHTADLSRNIYAIRSYNRELTSLEIKANCDFNDARYGFTSAEEIKNDR